MKVFKVFAKLTLISFVIFFLLQISYGQQVEKEQKIKQKQIIQKEQKLKEKKLLIADFAKYDKKGRADRPEVWLIPYAHNHQYSTPPYYYTVIIIRNLARNISSDIEVEWFNNDGSYAQTEIQRARIEPEKKMVFISGNTEMKYWPFYGDHFAALSRETGSTVIDDFLGYVKVHSSHPLVIVTAYIGCRESKSRESSVRQYFECIQTFPRGGTKDLFLK